MNLADWQSWCAASGRAKERLLSKLMADNEPMVATFAKRFMKATNRYVAPIREDLLQAARIGMLRAMGKWDPEKGKFSTLAFFWMRYEMQLTLRHATPITMPTNSATIPRHAQDAAAAFEAKHGAPPPTVDGVKPSVIRRAEKANIRFVGLHHAASNVPQEGPDLEQALDAKRDTHALRGFMKTLTKAEKTKFLAGKSKPLIDRAKAFIEASRG